MKLKIIANPDGTLSGSTVDKPIEAPIEYGYESPPEEVVRAMLSKQGSVITDPRVISNLEKLGILHFENQIEASTVSQHPDQLELWEAYHILSRKRFYVDESGDIPIEVLTKLFHEECFLVDTHPELRKPPRFLGSYGVTTGGLISHFYSNYKNLFRDNIELKRKSDIKETIFEIPSKQRREYVNNLLHIYYPNGSYDTIPQVSRYLSGILFEDDQPNDVLLTRFDNALSGTDSMFNPLRVLVRGVGLSYGFRLDFLLSMPEFTSEYRGDLSRAIDTQGLNRSEVIEQAWHHSSLLIKNGNYQEALKLLVILRQDPEMQIFFKYISPSGFLNEAPNTDRTYTN